MKEMQVGITLDTCIAYREYTSFLTFYH